MPEDHRCDNLLTKAFIIASAFAFLEEDVQTFCHVDSEEAIEITEHGCQARQGNCFGDGVGSQMLSSERGNL